MWEWQIIIQNDPHIQMVATVTQIVKDLGIIETVMYSLLNYESMYWVVYNGTVHIYEVNQKKKGGAEEEEGRISTIHQ